MEFQIETYIDGVLCDVMPMDVFHMLLGRPWQFDKKVTYDEKENTFTFEKHGRRHTLHLLKDENLEEQVSPKVLLVGAKEFSHHLKETKVNYVMVGKLGTILTNTKFDNFPIEIQDVLDENVDIVMEDFQMGYHQL